MNKFDDLLNQIQNDTPAAEAQAQAAENVRRTLFGAAAAGAETLRGCEDFRTLFASYLQKTLPDARRLLVEDHLRECVNCRKAMDRARGVAPKLHTMPLSKPSAPKWAIAAAIVAAVGISAVAARNYFPVLSHSGALATVQSSENMLYRVASNGNIATVEGTDLSDGEEVRTPANSRAVIRLWDGSRIEMNERASLSVTLSWRGTVIHLERGQIVVQAAKQKRGKLFVNTGDSEVSVVGTIFAVNKGTLGSRVSVVEGQVNVEQSGHKLELKPGDQSTSDPALAKVGVEAEIAWSRDAERYLAIMGELNILQKRLETLPAGTLRYQSKLLLYMPENTRLFASVPNMGVQLTQAKAIFDERLRSSEVLRSWWMAKENDHVRQNVDFLLDQLKTLSSYLGEEVVVFVSGEKQMSCVIAAETTNAAGLKDYLDRTLAAPNGAKLPIAYSIKNNLLLFSEKAPQVAAVEAIVARGGSASTPFRRRVQQAYTEGAGWLFAGDVEQIYANSVNAKDRVTSDSLGFDNMQYVTLERRDIANRVENRIGLSFSGQRQGVASWLATPGPMTTLQFVSPDAGGAASIIAKQPRAMLDELMRLTQRVAPNFQQLLTNFQRETGLNPLDDIATPLGSELTVAIDGPLLPIPSWKLAVEVNQPQRLETSIETLIASYNRMAAIEKTPLLVLKKEQVSSRLFYTLSGGRLPLDVHYVYVDSYLLMGADRTLLTQAIQNRETGRTLLRSDKFRALLPSATNPNFSAVVYHNLGGVLGPLADMLANGTNVTPAQKESMKAVKDAAPGLVAAYADADKITAATVGNFAGLNLGMFAAKGGILGAVLH